MFQNLFTQESALKFLRLQKNRYARYVELWHWMFIKKVDILLAMIGNIGYLVPASLCLRVGL